MLKKLTVAVLACLTLFLSKRMTDGQTQKGAPAKRAQATVVALF